MSLDQKNLLLLKQAANPESMKEFLEKRLPFYYPKNRLCFFRLEDQSQYKFKKAVRCVVVLCGPSGKKEKKIIRASVPSARRVWEIKASDQALSFLYKHGFNRGALQVNRPLGYYPQRRMQMYEEYPGHILTKLILNNGRGLENHVLMASRWLVKFHQLKPRLGQIKTIKNVKKELDEFRANFKGYSADCHRDGQMILGAFWDKFKNIYSPKDYQLIHGDLNTNNIVVNGKALGVIDFGSSYRFDPLCDTADFLIQLERLSWQNKVPRKLIEKLSAIFLANYLKTGGKEARQKLDLWKVWHLMQITSFSLSMFVNTPKNRRDLERTIISKTLPAAKQLLKFS